MVVSLVVHHHRIVLHANGANGVHSVSALINVTVLKHAIVLEHVKTNPPKWTTKIAHVRRMKRPIRKVVLNVHVIQAQEKKRATFNVQSHRISARI